MSSVSGVVVVVVMRGMWVKSQELYFYFIFLNFSLIINHSITSIIIDKIFFDFEFGGGPVLLVECKYKLIVLPKFKIDTPPNRSSMITFPTYSR